MNVSRNYGAHFVAGDRLIARDAAGQWGAARGMDVAERDGVRSLKVHFQGWGPSHDAWVPVGRGRLQPNEESRSQHGQSAVGRRLEVQWDENVWYSGTVSSFNPKTQRHKVTFDDGDSERYHLDHEAFAGLLRWLDPGDAEPAQPAEPSSSSEGEGEGEGEEEEGEGEEAGGEEEEKDEEDGEDEEEEGDEEDDEEGGD